MPDAGRRIVVDSFERDSGIVEALRASGMDVVLKRLDVGDYDLGSGVRVERKTIPDLHLSLQRGRLWRQIGELRHVARLPYLLIEGPTLDHPSTTPEAIRGACLAIVGQGVPILWSEDGADSAAWLRLLSRRSAGAPLSRDRPAYAQRLKPPAVIVREAMLTTLAARREWLARSRIRLRNGHPGGTHVACSGQAEPRHLRVNP